MLANKGKVKRMTEKKFIAYYRVSTDRQGISGLGLEAQKKAVTDYLNGGENNLLAEYTEIESGKSSRRPKLIEALESCKKHKATLVIAKLDRLGRNVAFISSLMESKVDFIAVDNPHANRLMLHMLAAFAEHEREQISKRTKEALAAAKKRGVVLGRYCKETLADEIRKRADVFALSMVNTIEEIKEDGFTTIRDITKELNKRGVPTYRKGSKWHIPTVHNLLKRIDSL